MTCELAAKLTLSQLATVRFTVQLYGCTSMTLMLKTYFGFIFVNLYTPVSYTSVFVHNQVK